MSLVIDEANPDDLSPLLDLYHFLHERDPALQLTAEVREIWRSILENPYHHNFVARAEGRMVSTCTLVVIPNLTRSTRPYAVIENVVTHPDFRKRGIGTQLLRHALRTAWAGGCYKVMLLTGRKDDATLRFYENAGFLRGVKTGIIAYPPADSGPGVSP